MKFLLCFAALSIVGCGGSSFEGAPTGDDAGAAEDGGGGSTDGAAVTNHDASGVDAGTDAALPADAAQGADGAQAADAAQGSDATTGVDASSPLDSSAPSDAMDILPDAGHALMACETCLEADCASAVQACEADTSCSETIQCVIASGCFGADAGIDACIMQCESSEGLTPAEKVQVTMDILAMSTCAPPCASSCAAPDGGEH